MMATLLDKLEKDALTFMDKRLSIEKSLQRDLEIELGTAYNDIKKFLSSLGNINVNYIQNLVQNEIRSIIQSHKDNAIRIMEDAINNNFEAGIEQASRFLSTTEEIFNPIIIEQDKNQEILLALLLYGRNLINGLYEDLLNSIDRELVSAFIIAKNQNSAINNQERNTPNDLTLNFVLAGSFLAKYIINSFRNITNRSNTISQTELNRALNHGILRMYISAKKEIPDLKVKWVEVKDQRLCKHCRERANGGEDGDGVYFIGDISPPPLHPNCRCVLIPFLYRWFIE